VATTLAASISGFLQHESSQQQEGQPGGASGAPRVVGRTDLQRLAERFELLNEG
jgi:hypothetical protein